MAVRTPIPPSRPVYPRAPLMQPQGGTGLPSHPGAQPTPGHQLPARTPAQQANRQVLSLTSISFGVRLAGTVNTAFPKAILVASQKFDMGVGLVSVSFSTSLVNTSADAVIGMFVGKNVGKQINVSSGTDLYIEHLAEAGLGTSFRSGVGFADDVCPQFGAGESIGIYATSSGTGIATNLLSGIVTIRYFQLF